MRDMAQTRTKGMVFIYLEPSFLLLRFLAVGPTRLCSFFLKKLILIYLLVYVDIVVTSNNSIHLRYFYW